MLQSCVLFSTVPSILTFDFDLLLGSFFTFGGPNGLFSGRDRFQKLFWGLLKPNHFWFINIGLFLLYHAIMSVMGGGWWVVGGWVGGWSFPSNYLVSIQHMFWLILCWGLGCVCGCGCCWAVTTTFWFGYVAVS